MDRILQTLINAAALYVAVLIVPNLDFIGEWWKLLVVAVIFGLVNTFLRPVLRILTLPITILTLGLFLLVINALMLMLTGWLAEQVGLGFRVDGFWSAVGGALVVTVVTWALDAALGDRSRR